MNTVNNWNKHTIEEFRANAGKVRGFFEGKHLLLLTTTGAKSGLRRINPVTYLPDGDRYIIFATKSGAPTHPDWYRNLLAHPMVTVEVGKGDGIETFEATATVVTGEERDRLYAKQVEGMPQFGDYEVKTKDIRVIPVIALEHKKG